MKQLSATTAALVALFVFSLAGHAQEKRGGQEEKMPTMAQDKKARMMEMMQDSTMMKMMMEHVAKDEHLREMMMQKMMKSAKSDTSKMMEMCKMMMQDENMHRMMMKGNRGMMEKKSDSMKQKQKDKGHPEQHHMKKGTGRESESSLTEVLVKFKPDTDETQIKAMASEVGMTEVKAIKKLNLRVFKLPAQKNLQEVIEHCQKEAFVEYAEPNRKYKTQQ